MTWSHTRLEATRCPFRFKQKYLDHNLEVEIGQSEGKLIHQALERYADHCRDKNLDSDLDVARAIAASLPQEVQDKHDFVSYCGMITFDWTAVIGFEKQYTLPVTDEDAFTGIVDLVELSDGVLKIYDYKTFWGSKEQPELAPAQLQRYAWLVGSQVDCESIEVSIVYLPSGTIHTWSIEPVFELDAILSALTGEIAQAKAIDRFGPVAGSWCRWCGYYCPLCEGDVVVKDEEGKEHLIAVIMEAQRRVDQAKKLLQDHCKETGPAKIGDTEAGYFAKTEEKYDERLVKAIIESKIDVAGVITINKQKLNQKGVQKKLEEVCIDPLAFATEETRTAWAIRKTTGDDDD